MDDQILILGTSPAGLQAAADLAELGLQVHLLESSPFLGGISRALPPSVQENSRLLAILKHPRIKVWTSSELVDLKTVDGDLQAEIRQNPRFIDLNKCTACGDCLEVCPVTIPGSDLKAIHFGGQPGCAAIAKAGISPCTHACPAGIHVQGYTALIRQGRFREAYELILDALPFPSVCGRVCNHYCEQACSRGQFDQAVSLMALKRFVADWADGHQDQLSDPQELAGRKNTGKKVAIVGAGPAGLTAARDLVRSGHGVTVFDDNPEAGGMMRVGIPPHRLPYQQMESEISRILAEGVELRLNTRVDDIPGLLSAGFDAVLVATGAHQAVKVDLEGSDHPDNWLSLEFLKRVCLGEKIDLSGRKVIVLGGGDVAMDAARSAIRLGTDDVSVLCRGLRAAENEIQEAQEEGVQILKGRAFTRIVVEKGAITGVECLEADVGEVVDGKRQFQVLPGTEHLVPGDLVIWAVGQRPDFSFLPPDESILLHDQQGIQADARMMTNLEGVFTAGDVRRGTTFFVVDAVGEGHRAAASIDHFLRGTAPEKARIEPEQVLLTEGELAERITWQDSAAVPRPEIRRLPVKRRAGNFKEVELALSEDEALREAGRCLACGPCSECMACVEVCQPGAVIHFQAALTRVLNFGAVIAEKELLPAPGLPDLISLDSALPEAGSAAAFKALDRLGLFHHRHGAGLPAAYHRPETGRLRTGLVVCQCGGEISQALDTSALAADALGWPEIVHSAELPFCCTDLGTAAIRDLAREQDLDRVLLAACSCCSLDQSCYSCTYQRTRCREKLGVFGDLQGGLTLEFVNIREQCAWVHPRSRKKATAAAARLIRAALARKPAGENGRARTAPLPGSVLIAGSGESGEICLAALSRSGLRVARSQLVGGMIVRAGSAYRAEWPEGNYQAEILVLAPGSGAELDHISRSVTLGSGKRLLGGLPPSRDLGLFICSPELDPASSGEGCAAAVLAWIQSISRRGNQPSAVVDEVRCRGCGTCSEICGYGIPVLVSQEGRLRAFINPLLCLDCGSCTAHCPSGAIRPGTQTESELENILIRLLE